MTRYFVFSVFLLAALLFLPVSRLVWVLSVRRLERKLEHKLDQEGLDGQLRRARVVALLLALPFSYLFNLTLFG